MKNVFIVIIVGFVVLCGLLVAESGLFAVGKPPTEAPCILLQQTATDEQPEAATVPALRNEGLRAADSANFCATGGPAKTIILGAKDPKTEDHETGFKFQLELSSKGAAIRTATFSNGPHNGRPSGFDDRAHKDPQPLDLLSPVRYRDGREILPMANKELVLVRQDRQFALDKLSWKSLDVETGADGSRTACFEVVIEDAADEPILRVSKGYKVVVGSYLVEYQLTLENLSGVEQDVRFNLRGPVGLNQEAFRSDARKVVGGFIIGKADKREVVSSRKDIQSSFFRRKVGLKDATLRYERALQTGAKTQIEEAEKNLRIGQVGQDLPDRYRDARFIWAAVTNKYFAAILRPVPDEGKDHCDWVADGMAWFYNPDGDERGDSGDETVGLDLRIKPVALGAKGQPDASKTYSFQLYLGPKDRDLFHKNALYKRLGFVYVIDFMSCCCPASIIRPLAFGILALMKAMYSFIPNYGVIIIILVFLMRLVLHPITKKSQVSMSKMSKLAPKTEEIKKKYANNKAELNKQLMQLYREQGASPIMGMLPMIVQMPIWIALWSAVNASIDLRGAPFLPFWITDLSMPDALVRFSTVTVPLLGWKIESLNLLPILMGVAFYLQQKLMPSQAASSSPQMAQQQKIMMIMFPIMFPLMLYKLASGVNLYIMTSTFAGVIEQHVIRKHIRKKEEQESKGLVAATSKTGGKVKKKKPKPFYKQF
jgi:YidC/Oxa1 family membrane protein insertase